LFNKEPFWILESDDCDDIIRAGEKGALALSTMRLNLPLGLEVEPKNQRYNPTHGRGEKQNLDGVALAFTVPAASTPTHTHHQNSQA
jgi:hypothetical protein